MARPRGRYTYVCEECGGGIPTGDGMKARCMVRGLSFILVLLHTVQGGSVDAQGDAVDVRFFHAAWGGNVEAVSHGTTLAPAVTERIAWSEPDAGSRALLMSPASHLKYGLESTFPGGAGSLELRMRPLRIPAAAGDILRLDGPEGVSLSLGFVPTGPRWVFRLQSRGAEAELAAWRDEIDYDQWNHLVLSWGDDATVTLYVNGRWLRSRPFAERIGGQATLDVRGVAGTDVMLGPFAMYGRCLTASQALLLAHSAGQPSSDRLARLQDQIRRDDEAAARRRELVTRLQGKVGRVYHTRGRNPGAVPLPEGIEAEGIRPEDIGKSDLTRFRVIYFPQGPNFQIEADQYAAIQDYVRRGGGYVGDCQGAYFAADKLRLLPIECYHNNIWGLYKILITPHFVTDDRRGEVTMHFGNGPIMVPGEGCTVLGTYAMKLPGNAVPAALVAGTYGAGRVILFGTHPLGEKVAFKGTTAHFSGKLLGTDRMFVNALLLASGLVDEDGVPQGR
jgi:hypothetical protein